MRRPLLAALLIALCASPAAGAWSWPADGPVLRPFVFGSNPYASGQHRGVDIGGAAGAPVRAPADGTVSFAGTVPTGGKTVTIQTPDGYAVTLVHLGSIAVTRGAPVLEGGVIGTIGPSGEPEVAEPYVHLGVRVSALPQGYVDPLTLLPVRGELSPVTGPASGVESVPAVAAQPEPAAGDATGNVPAELAPLPAVETTLVPEPHAGVTTEAASVHSDERAGDIASAEPEAAPEAPSVTAGDASLSAQAAGGQASEAAAAPDVAAVSASSPTKADVETEAAEISGDMRTTWSPSGSTIDEGRAAAGGTAAGEATASAAAELPEAPVVGQPERAGIAQPTPVTPSTGAVTARVAVRAGGPRLAADVRTEPKRGGESEIRPTAPAVGGPVSAVAAPSVVPVAEPEPEPSEGSAPVAAAAHAATPESANASAPPSAAHELPSEVSATDGSLVAPADDGVRPPTESVGDASSTELARALSSQLRAWSEVAANAGVAHGFVSDAGEVRALDGLGTVEPGIPDRTRAPTEPRSEVATGIAPEFERSAPRVRATAKPRAAARTAAPEPGTAGRLLRTLTLLAILLLVLGAGAAGAARVRRPAPLPGADGDDAAPDGQDTARIMFVSTRVPEPAFDDAGVEPHPGRARVAVRQRTASHRPRRGVRSPVRRLRPLSQAQRGPRPHGERDGRARNTGDGRRRSRGRVAA